MKMTLQQACEMFARGETPEEYERRIKRLRRLANERDDLEDAIEVLKGDPRAKTKQKRLAKVLAEIEQIK